ncbi:hypothetical protein TcBrA4_0122340 [Trypanosoma cruzi]|nr:hypothetical protein TcBrA4_0122340 [Trypanosoma cruzi]
MRSGYDKPPMAPRSSSCEKPKSILKSTNSNLSPSKSPTLSTRRVSFEEEESFLEPRLRFGTPTHATHSHLEEVVVRTPVATRSEVVSSGPVEMQIRRYAEWSATEPTSMPERPADLSPDSPQDSPTIIHRERIPTVISNRDEKEEKGGTLCPDNNLSTATLSRAPTAEAVVSARPCSAEELSPLPDVSVSDTTASPSSLLLQLGRSGSRRSSMENCMFAATTEQYALLDVKGTLFPDGDTRAGRHLLNIAPVSSEACGRSLVLPGGSVFSSFSVQKSPIRESSSLFFGPSSQHEKWCGSGAGAIVRPPRAWSPTAAGASNHSLLPPRQRGVEALLFEGGVNPDDLVFDDIPDCSVPEANSNDNGLPHLTESSHCRRMLDFSMQLYPNLVQPEEPPHTTDFQELSFSNFTDGDGESALQERSVRKGRRAAGDGDPLSMPPQPFLRVSNAGKKGKCLFGRPSPTHLLHGEYTNACGAVENPPELTDFAVRSTGEEVLGMKENQKTLICRDQKSTPDGVTTTSLLECLHASSQLYPRQAKPVMVEYINKLSASWQEALRGDMHRRRRHRGHTSDEVHQPHYRKMTRQLFPGVFFGHAWTNTETHHVNCLTADTIGVCPLIPIKKTVVVMPSPRKTKKKRCGVKPVTTTAVATPPAISSSSSSNRKVDDCRAEGEKATPEKLLREEACAESEKFEDVHSYVVQLTPVFGMTPSGVATYSSQKESRNSDRKKAARTPTSVEKSGSRRNLGSVREHCSVKTTKEVKMEKEEEEEERRAKRFERLCRAFRPVSNEGAFFSGDKACITGCGGHRPLRDHDYGHPATNNELAGPSHCQKSTQPKKKFPPLPSPSFLTVEGLIHTPEQAASLVGSEEAADSRPIALFAPARSVSPPGIFPGNRAEDSGKNVLKSHVGVLPERCVSNRSAVRAFAHEISDIVHALRESNWAKIL